MSACSLFYKIKSNDMKNTRRKRNMREIRIVPQGAVALANGEAAKPGQAVAAVNIREQEQSMQVTGLPVRVGQVPEDDRLLTLAAGHMITCHGSTVKLDGAHGVTIDGTIVGAHVVGPFVVIVATTGLTYLLLADNGWQRMDPADAIPTLAFTANVNTTSADIPAVTFESPYSHWQAPLADADINVYSALLRSAWNTLNADARAEGFRTAPVLVRWAVRLIDGSYLWMSDPVRVGDETLTNADRVSAVVNSNNSGFTGTQATAMTLKRYLLGISLVRAIPEAWQPLVASIDVLATDEAQLVSSSRALDYRCLMRTAGGREYVLEMGLTRRSSTAIGHQMAASSWRLIATAPASARTGSQDFTAPVEALTLTASQCATIATPFRVTDVVCSTVAAGRLYCCNSRGEVVVSAPGNALIEAHRRAVLGTVPIAMVVVTSPLYSGGFGRYSVYVFSDDGIYAIPQGATGHMGEARLVDRTIIAAAVHPVEAGHDVWLVSRHGHLCRLSGSRLTVCQRDVAYRALAWCNAYDELWLLPPEGDPVVMMASGTMSRRTVDVAQLYSDPRHAVAVAPTGDVLDLEQEQAELMPVEWRSHPVALHPLMGQTVHRVVWHVSGEEVSLTLRVTGQRGIKAQDSDVSVTTVEGRAEQPLASPTMAVQSRTLRLAVTGEAQTGSLLLPTLLYSLEKPKRT